MNMDATEVSKHLISNANHTLNLDPVCKELMFQGATTIDRLTEENATLRGEVERLRSAVQGGWEIAKHFVKGADAK